MKKKELMALLEERESFIEEQEKELETLRRRFNEQDTALDRSFAEMKATAKRNIDLTNENESLKRSLESKEDRISNLKKLRDEVGDKAEELWRANERLSRELKETKDELNRTRSGNDALLELVKTLQPKENQKPVKCEKGEWCKTCTFNKPVTFIRNGDRIYQDICMKNCSCNNFVAKED